MTDEQRHIIEKMGTVHKVKIYAKAEKGFLIVFSHNENAKQYLSYRIGPKGTATLLSTIKEAEYVNEKFSQMRTLTEYTD